MSSAPVQEGDILAGKFRIDKVLGEGGMGVVVAATNIALEQKVAIKFLLPDAAASEEIRARFGREARAAAKIQSEHVARVIDVGELEGGAPFMVMEFLEGKDLAAVLDERGRLPVEEAAGYMLEACEAIAEAHRAGIVHRDLKPPNLFLAKQADGSLSVKVLDFGISKSLDPASGALTKTSALMGSPYYMSPEQMTSAKHVDARSDIWALGVILYQLLSGDVPYYGETLPEIVAAILQNRPVPVRDKVPEIPEGIAKVIDSCLQSDPKARYANIAVFARALAAYGPASGQLSVGKISRVIGEPVMLGSSSLVDATAVTDRPPAGKANSPLELPTIVETSPNGESTSIRGNDPPSVPSFSNTQHRPGSDNPAAAKSNTGRNVGIAAVLALGVLGFALRGSFSGSAETVRGEVPTAARSVAAVIPTIPTATESAPLLATTALPTASVAVVPSAPTQTVGTDRHAHPKATAAPKNSSSAVPATTAAPTTKSNPLQMLPQ